MDERNPGCWRYANPFDTRDHLITTSSGPSPTFISDIFYLTSAVNHYGLNRTLQTYEELHKHLDDLKRHQEFMTGSLNSLTPNVRTVILFPCKHFLKHCFFMKNPLYARTQHAIKQTNVRCLSFLSSQPELKPLKTGRNRENSL